MDIHICIGKTKQKEKLVKYNEYMLRISMNENTSVLQKEI